MKLRFFPLIVLALLSAQSCLVKDMGSAEELLEVSDVLVPADDSQAFGKEDGTVQVYVPVRCSESWSAKIADASRTPWLKIVSQNGLNPEGAVVTGALVLSCEENRDAEARSAVIRFVTAGSLRRDIVLTQSAKTARISIEGENAVNISAGSDKDVRIKIVCNTAWEARLDTEASNTTASITPDRGNGNAVVTISTPANYDCSASSTAVIRFLTDGTDSVSFSLTRAASKPFIGVDKKDEQQNEMPAATSGRLRFNCNSPWKAEVLESNIRDFQLATLAGEGGMGSEIPFTMSPNDGDESLMAKVKLSLASNAGKSVVVMVRHWCGFTIDVDFSKVSDAASCPLQPADTLSPQIPFTTTTGLNSGEEVYNYKFISGENEYLFGICNPLINISGTGSNGYIRLGQGYVRFPAVEGYRLGYVEFTTAATGKVYSITDAPAGTIFGAKKTTAKEETVSWELDGTEYGKSYYEIISTNASRQHNLKLLYVK